MTDTNEAPKAEQSALEQPSAAGVDLDVLDQLEALAKDITGGDGVDLWRVRAGSLFDVEVAGGGWDGETIIENVRWESLAAFIAGANPAAILGLIAIARSLPALKARVKELEEGLETIAEERDSGRHDGLPEGYPVHDADTMFAIATSLLTKDTNQ